MNLKCSKFFWKNVKLSLPKSADATKGKVLVFKRVSNNVKIDFKELLNKITHAEADE